MKNFDIEEVKAYIRASTPESAIYVGCDSAKTTKHGVLEAVFATVVVIHHSSRNGAKVFGRIEYLPDFKTNRERLMKEVELAIFTSTEILDAVGERSFQLHLDLNNNPEHYSNCAVKEALGWCRGMGLEPVIKPNSFAASAAADYYAVGAV